MVLEYIWIDKFRVLDKIGFNFSSQRKYTYDPGARKLKISQNESHIESFFGTHISEVTALIGENGVGKSSIIEFLIRNLSNFGDGFMTEYEDGNFFAVFSNVILVKGYDLISNKDELKGLGFNIVDYSKNNPFRELIGNGYEKLAYIYYSNVFDYKESYENLHNLYDISTNHLLIEDSRNAEDQTLLYMFVHSEIKRQIDCLSEIRFESPFKIPRFLHIEISKNVYKYKHKIKLESRKETGLDNIAQICSLQLPNQQYESVIFLIYQNLLMYRSEINKDLYSGIEPDLLRSLFETNFSGLSKLDVEQQKEFTLIKNVSDSFWELITTETTTSGVSEWGLTLGYTLSKDNSIFFNFINSINVLMNIDTFIYYSWPSLSSGEKALLSLIGRLNYANKTLNDEDNDKISELLIMMDEFDLYLHPVWQQNIFNTLIQTLPKIFPGKKIQLILSSHSPFLVSDLPNSNVLFLKKDFLDNDEPSGYFTCKIEDNFQKATFGSNIHSLFTESFFMSKGLIGEFAKEKITTLIEFLKGEALSSKKFKHDKDSSQKVINFIGEPLIKNQLQDMWNEKFSHNKVVPSKGELLERVKQLELENEKLRDASNQNK